MIELQAALNWLTILDKVIEKGGGVMADIGGVLAAHGIEADTAALDTVIADTERRKALAKEDAQR